MFDDEVCYRALLARDPRFDGLFFVGISSTGIYCRSVCTARTAKRSSCTFFPTAAAAEASGFRPCLRCRPELAPGFAPYEGRLAAVAEVLARIESGGLNGSLSLRTMAAEVGLSERQLRRCVKQATGATPIQIAQTTRLLLAKQLLTETSLPITRLAMAAGFSSLRRFNELFKNSYGIAPGHFRKQPSERMHGASLTLRRSFRPPYDWPAMLGFLNRRATMGVEEVTSECYRRTLEVNGRCGWIEIRLAEGANCLEISVAVDLLPDLQSLLSRVVIAFDLSARPDVIDDHLGNFDLFRSQIQRHPGVRVPGTFDGFELAWRAILGQQVSVRAATTLAGRFADLFGGSVDTPFSELNRLTPKAESVAAVTPGAIAKIGIPISRARSIHALAVLCAGVPKLLTPGASVDEARGRLLALPGVGAWTAEYIIMRALHWADAYPGSDLGIRKSLERHGGGRRAIDSELWRPWRSYAAMRLWNMLADQSCVQEYK